MISLMLITPPDCTINSILIHYLNIFTRYTSIKIGTLVSANQTEYTETYSASGSYMSLLFTCYLYTGSPSKSFHTSHTWAIKYRNSTAHEFSKSAWMRYRIFLTHFRTWVKTDVALSVQEVEIYFVVIYCITSMSYISNRYIWSYQFHHNQK